MTLNDLTKEELDLMIASIENQIKELEANPVEGNLEKASKLKEALRKLRGSR